MYCSVFRRRMICFACASPKSDWHVLTWLKLEPSVQIGVSLAGTPRNTLCARWNRGLARSVNIMRQGLYVRQTTCDDEIRIHHNRHTPKYINSRVTHILHGPNNSRKGDLKPYRPHARQLRLTILPDHMSLYFSALGLSASLAPPGNIMRQ